MKRVLALRHAKAVERGEAATDRERVLAERGRQEAVALGKLIAGRGYVPHRILCSPSARARETAGLVTRALDGPPVVEVVESLYTGGAVAYTAELAGCPESADTVLIVGHNPSMEEMVAALVGRNVPLKTCWLAVVDVPAETWAGLPAAGRARLVEVLDPGAPV